MTLFRSCPVAARAAVTALLLFVSVAVYAGPGAHGPGGEHLDAPATAGAVGGTAPRVEARSELFELVGRLEHGALAILVNRFETNEPVLDAKLELSAGAASAAARFDAGSGAYIVDDAGIVTALSAAGEHALLFTIVAGAESDLLDGTLRVAAAQAPAGDHGHVHDDHGHGHLVEYLALGGAALVILAVGYALWRRRRRRGGAYALAGRAQ